MNNNIKSNMNYKKNIKNNSIENEKCSKYINLKILKPKPVKLPCDIEIILGHKIFEFL